MILGLFIVICFLICITFHYMQKSERIETSRRIEILDILAKDVKRLNKKLEIESGSVQESEDFLEYCIRECIQEIFDERHSGCKSNGKQ